MPAVGKQLLVIGNGGREHAICWKLSQSAQVTKIYALPGNPGIALEKKCENVLGVNAKDFNVSIKRQQTSVCVCVCVRVWIHYLLNLLSQFS